MRTTDPEGVSYRVRRRWLPWRWRKRVSGRPLEVDVLDGLDVVDGFAGLVLSIVAAIAFVVVVPIVVLVLLTGVEFLLLLLVLPLAVIARLFGKHWQVQVRRGRTLLYEVDGGDWAQSRLVIADLAERIRLGQLEQGRILSTEEGRGAIG